MFTGIVEKVVRGKVYNGMLILEEALDVSEGESLAVNGVCLTVSKVTERAVFFDVGEETLRRSNLGRSRFFNIERSLKVGERFHGHVVLGHVDGTVRFLGYEHRGNSYFFNFSMPVEKWAVAVKGSIALNGISLTVAGISLDSFCVQVIPYTYEHTNLKYLQAGDPVNYEIDVFARYVREVLRWKS